MASVSTNIFNVITVDCSMYGRNFAKYSIILYYLIFTDKKKPNKVCILFIRFPLVLLFALFYLTLPLYAGGTGLLPCPGN